MNSLAVQHGGGWTVWAYRAVEQPLGGITRTGSTFDLNACVRPISISDQSIKIAVLVGNGSRLSKTLDGRPYLFADDVHVELYGLSEADSTTQLSIFIAAAADTAQGGVSASSDVYGCGVLTIARTTSAMRLADEKCPTWILDWNGDEAQEVSISGIAEKYEIDKEW